jgi:hypothetical protein
MGQNFSLQQCLSKIFPCCFPAEEDLKGKKLDEVPELKELEKVQGPTSMEDNKDYPPPVRTDSSRHIIDTTDISDKPAPEIEVVSVRTTDPESLKEPTPKIEGGPGTYPDENGSFDHDKIVEPEHNISPNEEKDRLELPKDVKDQEDQEWVSITDEEVSQARRKRNNTD